MTQLCHVLTRGYQARLTQMPPSLCQPQILEHPGTCHSCGMCCHRRFGITCNKHRFCCGNDKDTAVSAIDTRSSSAVDTIRASVVSTTTSKHPGICHGRDIRCHGLAIAVCQDRRLCRDNNNLPSIRAGATAVAYGATAGFSSVATDEV